MDPSCHDSENYVMNDFFHSLGLDFCSDFDRVDIPFSNNLDCESMQSSHCNAPLTHTRKEPLPRAEGDADDSSSSVMMLGATIHRHHSSLVSDYPSIPGFGAMDILSSVKIKKETIPPVQVLVYANQFAAAVRSGFAGHQGSIRASGRLTAITVKVLYSLPEGVDVVWGAAALTKLFELRQPEHVVISLRHDPLVTPAPVFRLFRKETLICQEAVHMAAGTDTDPTAVKIRTKSPGNQDLESFPLGDNGEPCYFATMTYVFAFRTTVTSKGHGRRRFVYASTVLFEDDLLFEAVTEPFEYFAARPTTSASDGPTLDEKEKNKRTSSDNETCDHGISCRTLDDDEGDGDFDDSALLDVPVAKRIRAESAASVIAAPTRQKSDRSVFKPVMEIAPSRNIIVLDDVRELLKRAYGCCFASPWTSNAGRLADLELVADDGEEAVNNRHRRFIKETPMLTTPVHLESLFNFSSDKMQSSAGSASSGSAADDADVIIRQPFDGMRRRVMFRGGAGIGKTTICTNMCRLWADSKLWTDTFDLVFFIPMTSLASYSHGRSWMEFVNDAHLEGTWSRDELRTLKSLLVNEASRILYIVDGLDSINSSLIVDGSDMSGLGFVLRQPNVLVTSRSAWGAISLVVRQLLQQGGDLRRLKITGLPDADLRFGFRRRRLSAAAAASRKPSDVSLHNRVELIQRLSSNDRVKSMLKVPAIYNLMISGIDAIVGERPACITNLICQMILDLCRKSLTEAISHSNTAPLRVTMSRDAHYRLRMALSQLDVMETVAPSFRFLSDAAWQCLVTGQKTFSRDFCDQYRTRHAVSSCGDEVDLLLLVESGVIGVEVGDQRSALHPSPLPENSVYSFRHDLFTDFFAAYRIVCLIHRCEPWLGDSGDPQRLPILRDVIDNIQTYKYHNHMLSMWRFVAGLLVSSSVVATYSDDKQSSRSSFCKNDSTILCIHWFLTQIESLPVDVIGLARCALLANIFDEIDLSSCRLLDAEACSCPRAVAASQALQGYRTASHSRIFKLREFIFFGEDEAQYMASRCLLQAGVKDGYLKELSSDATDDESIRRRTRIVEAFGRFKEDDHVLVKQLLLLSDNSQRMVPETLQASAIYSLMMVGGTYVIETWLMLLKTLVHSSGPVMRTAIIAICWELNLERNTPVRFLPHMIGPGLRELGALFGEQAVLKAAYEGIRTMLDSTTEFVGMDSFYRMCIQVIMHLDPVLARCITAAVVRMWRAVSLSPQRASQYATGMLFSGIHFFPTTKDVARDLSVSHNTESDLQHLSDLQTILFARVLGFLGPILPSARHCEAAATEVIRLLRGGHATADVCRAVIDALRLLGGLRNADGDAIDVLCKMSLSEEAKLKSPLLPLLSLKALRVVVYESTWDKSSLSLPSVVEILSEVACTSPVARARRLAVDALGRVLRQNATTSGSDNPLNQTWSSIVQILSNKLHDEDWMVQALACVGLGFGSVYRRESTQALTTLLVDERAGGDCMSVRPTRSYDGGMPRLLSDLNSIDSNRKLCALDAIIATDIIWNGSPTACLPEADRVNLATAFCGCLADEDSEVLITALMVIVTSRCIPMTEDLLEMTEQLLGYHDDFAWNSLAQWALIWLGCWRHPGEVNTVPRFLNYARSAAILPVVLDAAAGPFVRLKDLMEKKRSLSIPLMMGTTFVGSSLRFIALNSIIFGKADYNGVEEIVSRAAKVCVALMMPDDLLPDTNSIRLQRLATLLWAIRNPSFPLSILHDGLPSCANTPVPELLRCAAVGSLGMSGSRSPDVIAALRKVSETVLSCIGSQHIAIESLVTLGHAIPPLAKQHVLFVTLRTVTHFRNGTHETFHVPPFVCHMFSCTTFALHDRMNVFITLLMAGGVTPSAINLRQFKSPAFAPVICHADLELRSNLAASLFSPLQQYCADDPSSFVSELPEDLVTPTQPAVRFLLLYMRRFSGAYAHLDAQRRVLVYSVGGPSFAVPLNDAQVALLCGIMDGLDC